MKKIDIRKLAYAAILLAICIISQFFKNISVYITGPIINTCLFICVLDVNLVWAIILSIITPITSFLITGSPIMAAIPIIIPAVCVGNSIMVLVTWALNKGLKFKQKSWLSMFLGAFLKALFMGGVIAKIIIPNMLPEAMLPKMKVFQTTFSVTQLITAVSGAVIAGIIMIPLNRSLSVQNRDTNV